MSAAKQSRNPATDTAAELRQRIVADVREDAKQISEQQDAAVRRIQQAEAEHDVELDAWRSEAAAARAMHAVEPERPPAPDLRQDKALLGRLQHEKDGLLGRETDALRGDADDVEAAWREAMTVLTTETAEALEPLRGLLEQVEEWRRLLAEVRSALDNDGNRRAVNGPSTRMPRRLELADIIALADGADILAPAPLPAQPKPLGPGASEEDNFHGRRRLGNLKATDPRNFL